MSTKHTPTPWKTWDGYYCKRIVGADDNPIADILRRGENFTDEELGNRRRIVAAVNACEGIETEVLEKTTGGLWNDVITDNLRKDEQIEELLDCFTAPEYDPTPLDWISAILAEFERHYQPELDDDPTATDDAKSHVRRFLEKAGAAVAKATGDGAGG